MEQEQEELLLALHVSWKTLFFYRVSLGAWQFDVQFSQKERSFWNISQMFTVALWSLSIEQNVWRQNGDLPEGLCKFCIFHKVVPIIWKPENILQHSPVIYYVVSIEVENSSMGWFGPC